MAVAAPAVVEAHGLEVADLLGHVEDVSAPVRSMGVEETASMGRTSGVAEGAAGGSRGRERRRRRLLAASRRSVPGATAGGACCAATNAEAARVPRLAGP